MNPMIIMPLIASISTAGLAAPPHAGSAGQLHLTRLYTDRLPALTKKNGAEYAYRIIRSRAQWLAFIRTHDCCTKLWSTSKTLTKHNVAVDFSRSILLFVSRGRVSQDLRVRLAGAETNKQQLRLQVVLEAGHGCSGGTRRYNSTVVYLLPKTGREITLQTTRFITHCRRKNR